MLIKAMKIYESFPVYKEIRLIEFNMYGLNLIVDTDDKQKSGNSIGKTTLLRLIDIAFGALNVKGIYQDFDTKSDNAILKNYIINSKIKVELIIYDEITSFESSLKVELFPNGKRYINNQLLTYKKYLLKLNELIFSNYDKPVFRNLIGKFIRISMSGDNNKFLKYANDYISDNDYRASYNFLFKFRDVSIENKINELKDNIKKYKNEIKYIKSGINYKNIEQVETKINYIESKVSELQRRQSTFIDKDIILDEQKIVDNRNRYVNLTRDYEKILFEITTIEKSIIEEKNNRITISEKELYDFYNEFKENVKILTKKFEDVVKFNKQISENKINTFSKLLDLKKRELESLNIEKEKFFKDNKSYMFLLEDGGVDEYLELQRQLLEYKQNLGETQNAHILFKENAEKLATAENLIEELEKEKVVDNTVKYIDDFNKIFAEFCKVTLGTEFYLYPNEKDFPISISNVAGSFSTGTRKTAITAFDISYIQYARNKKLVGPKFLIHDVIESIDKNDLDTTINLIKSYKIQYITAVLKEKLSGQKNITKEDIVLELSSDSKLFKI